MRIETKRELKHTKVEESNAQERLTNKEVVGQAFIREYLQHGGTPESQRKVSSPKGRPRDEGGPYCDRLRKEK
jgi:hypothetical protein